jgi:hypothetical protein
MMTKHKGDIEIGHRMLEELVRLYGTQAEAIRRFRCKRHSIDYWRDGGTPGGYMLAKLYYCGGDVLYVLTGKKEKAND